MGVSPYYESACNVVIWGDAQQPWLHCQTRQPDHLTVEHWVSAPGSPVSQIVKTVVKEPTTPPAQYRKAPLTWVRPKGFEPPTF